MGCDLGQGFLWRVPAGADDVSEWLTTLQAGRRAGVTGPLAVEP